MSSGRSSAEAWGGEGEVIELWANGAENSLFLVGLKSWECPTGNVIFKHILAKNFETDYLKMYM